MVNLKFPPVLLVRGTRQLFVLVFLAVIIVPVTVPFRVNFQTKLLMNQVVLLKGLIWLKHRR